MRKATPGIYKGSHVFQIYFHEANKQLINKYLQTIKFREDCDGFFHRYEDRRN